MKGSEGLASRRSSLAAGCCEEGCRCDQECGRGFWNAGGPDVVIGLVHNSVAVAVGGGVQR